MLKFTIVSIDTAPKGAPTRNGKILDEGMKSLTLVADEEDDFIVSASTRMSVFESDPLFNVYQVGKRLKGEIVRCDTNAPFTQNFVDSNGELQSSDSDFFTVFIPYGTIKSVVLDKFARNLSKGNGKAISYREEGTNGGFRTVVMANLRSFQLPNNEDRKARLQEELKAAKAAKNKEEEARLEKELIALS